MFWTGPFEGSHEEQEDCFSFYLGSSNDSIVTIVMLTNRRSLSDAEQVLPFCTDILLLNNSVIVQQQLASRSLIDSKCTYKLCETVLLYAKYYKYNGVKQSYIQEVSCYWKCSKKSQWGCVIIIS